MISFKYLAFGSSVQEREKKVMKKHFRHVISRLRLLATEKNKSCIFPELEVYQPPPESSYHGLPNRDPDTLESNSDTEYETD